MHTRKEYHTKDLGLSAFLIERGHKLLRLEPAGKLKVMVFEAKAESDTLSYYNGGQVSARSFYDTVRSLKAQCNPR